MKILNFALVACVALAASCNSDKKSSKENQSVPSDAAVDGDAAYVVEQVSYMDSVVIGDSKAVAKCSLGYLKSDDKDDALTASVDKWIRHMLRDADTSVAVGEPMARYVVDEVLESGGEDLREWTDSFGKDRDDGYFPMSYEYDYSIKPLIVAPRYVTMLYTSYVYTGGAHGGADAIGQTFAADNGLALDLDMFKEGTTEKVLQLVKKGLMEQYFEVSTDDEFKDMLLVNNGTLPFPANPPYFEENGVCFLYQQYEIAPYAAGMPQCLIPFETLRPYFTQAALDLIDVD